MRVVGWSPGVVTGTPNVTLTIDAPRWHGVEFVVSIAPDGALAGLLTQRREPDAVALTAALFQRIPVGALVKTAREFLRDFKLDFERLSPPAGEPDAVLESLDGPVYGRDEQRDLRLARICRRYLQLHQHGTLNPMWKRIIATEFDLSESSVPTTIMRARQRHFLTPVKPGQPGGELTEKARRLLGPSRSTWDRLSADQQAQELRRHPLREPIKRDLRARFDAGQIDRKWWRLLVLAIEPLVTLRPVREVYGKDEPELSAIEAAARELLRTYPELKP